MKAHAPTFTAYYTCKHPGGHKLPNAATRQYYMEKLVDGLLAAAITLAAVVITVVLITM